jgi:hypothetical protein
MARRRKQEKIDILDLIMAFMFYLVGGSFTLVIGAYIFSLIF